MAAALTLPPRGNKWPPGLALFRLVWQSFSVVPK